MIVNVVMPKMGESITEGTILEWRKKVGDKIELDEILLEIGTDKVDSEIPSSAAGVIVELLAEPNDVVEVGKTIAKINVEGNAGLSNNENQIVNKSSQQDVQNSLENSNKTIPENNKELKEEIKEKKFYSPVVMKIVAEEGVSLNELDSVRGTGRGGRITKKDIIQYLNEKKQREPYNQNVNKDDLKPMVNVISPREEEMSHMRQMISKHMVDSLSTSAHVYVMTDVDMSRIVDYVALNEKNFKDQESFNLTYTPFIVQATVKALLEFPIMNSSLVESTIIYHKNINIGLAVAVGEGLMVPSILNCEEKNFLGFCRSVNDVAKRTKEGKIKPDELSGSTFSITNFGVFGVTLGTPIINQPNIGILGVGALKKQPVVIEHSNGDSIGIKSMMMLSLGFDHRLIDGAKGSKFINAIKRNLESMPLESNF